MTEIFQKNVAQKIIHHCTKIIKRAPDIFFETNDQQLDCPICMLPIPFTTRICCNCGIGVPDLNIHTTTLENEETNEVEVSGSSSANELLYNASVLEIILLTGEEWKGAAPLAKAASSSVAGVRLDPEKLLKAALFGSDQDTCSTRYKIFDTCENLISPKLTDYIGAYRTRGIVYANLNMLEHSINDFTEIIRFKLFAIRKLQSYVEAQNDSKNLSRFLDLKFLIYRNLAFDYVRRGVVYSKMKQYNRTFEDFETALGLNFYLFSYWLSDGGITPENKTYDGQFDEVLNNYKTYILANPNDAHARACYGFCLKFNCRSNDEQAIQALSGAIKRAPDLYFAYYMRGFCHGYNFDKAIEDFTEAILKNNNHAGSFFARGRIYYSLREFGRNIEDFSAGIQRDIEYSHFNSHGIWTPYSSWLEYLQKKKSFYTERIVKLSKNIDRAPQITSKFFKRGAALFKRGEIYYELGHFDRSYFSIALKDFTETIQLEPTEAIGYIYFGLTLIELAQYDDAIDAFNKALGISPGNSFAYNSRGIAYCKKGDYVQANHDFRKLKGFSVKDRMYNMYYRVVVEQKLGVEF